MKFKAPMVFALNTFPQIQLTLSNYLLPVALVLAAAAPAVAQTSSQQRANDLGNQEARYQQAIAILNGSYDESSSEMFLSLANVQNEMGEYAQANANYQEAIQALRITQGLYSEDQLQVMDAFNASLLEQEEWEQLDANLHLAQHISSKLFEPQDPRYIARATRLASWKIKAYQTGIYRADDDRSVQEAAKIFRRLAENVPETDPDYNEKRADYFSAKGLAHFYSAAYVAELPLESFRGNATSSGSQSQCFSMVMSVDGPAPPRSVCQGGDAVDPEIFVAQQRAKNETVRRHLADMRESFSDAIRALELEPTVTLRRLADAVLHLGDASLLAQDYPRANSQYARAWELLSRDGESLALRDQLLGAPVKVMQDVLDELLIDQIADENMPEGTIAFDVTVRGEIENIGIQGNSAELDKEHLGAIAIKLDQSTYRPKISDGKPVKSRLTVSVADL